MLLTYMLIKNYRQDQISHELGLSQNTVSQWAHFMRDIVVDWARSTSEMIGGPGKKVEIDESKFGRRKYNKGHKVEGQWVFGGVERGSNKCFLVAVEKRDAKTLTKIIKEWILPGILT